MKTETAKSFAWDRKLALGASVPSASGCILARDHLFRKFSGREDKIAPEFQSSER